MAAGRFRDVSAVVAAGVSLLQHQEKARAELLASVLAAEEEADRDGYLTAEDMMTRVEARLGPTAHRPRVRLPHNLAPQAIRDVEDAAAWFAGGPGANRWPADSHGLSSRQPAVFRNVLYWDAACWRFCRIPTAFMR